MKSEFSRKVLKNGMTLLFEKRDVPVVTVAFAVRNGGINDSEEEKGISHFIEHMLYKGTKNRTPKQITEEIERNGGEMNGFTSEELTAYWCKIPSKHLNIALNVLSDLVKNSLFEGKELEKERKVIFEEIKMNRDNPMKYVFHKISSCLYDPNVLNVLGTTKTLNSIDRKKMVSKFEKLYKPNNMVLAVVGNADFGKLEDFVEKTFKKEEGEIFESKFRLKNESRIEKRNGLDQASLILAYHVPLASDNKSYAARVLSCLMGEGMSSRLFQEIREKRNLAYAIKGEAEINKRFAYNFVYVGTTKENVEKVKKLILEEFDNVVKTLDEKELNSVKEQLVGNYYIEMEDSQNQMVKLLFSEVCGNAKDFYDFEKKIREVKLEDVKKLAKSAKENFSFFALVPE